MKQVPVIQWRKKTAWLRYSFSKDAVYCSSCVVFCSKASRNIFRLFVILSLTQLYRYTPEIFLFSTATFKYTYQTNWTRIFSERRLVYFSVIETDTGTSDLRYFSQTNWTRIFSERRLVYFSVIETDTATSGPV
jgi:hypothetical protein